MSQEETLPAYTFVSVALPEPKFISVRAEDYKLIPEKKHALNDLVEAAPEHIKRFFDGKLSDSNVNYLLAANDYCSTPDIYRSIFTLVNRAIRCSTHDKLEMNDEAVQLFIDTLKNAYDTADAATALQTLLATL